MPGQKTNTARLDTVKTAALARARKQLRKPASFKVIVSMSAALLCWYLILKLILAGADGTSYFWQWYRVWPVFFTGEDGSFFSSPIWVGLRLTLLLSAVSMLLSMLFAAITTAMRLAGGPVARTAAIIYVQCVRNIPLLVLIFFVYFVIAPWLGINAFTSAVVALSLFEGAYMSEILRAGVLSIPGGQWEASRSLGLPDWFTAREIILPQAVRHILPPFLSQSVSLIKDSSLASAIGVAELTLQGRITVSSTFMSLEIWLTVAAVYLLVCLALTGLTKLLAIRLNRGWK